MARVLYRDLLKKLYLKNISYITCTGHERNCYHVALRQVGDGNHFISRNHICFRPNIILHSATIFFIIESDPLNSNGTWCDLFDFRIKSVYIQRRKLPHAVFGSASVCW